MRKSSNMSRLLLLPQALTVTKALAFLLWKPIDHHGHDLSLDVLEAILQLDWTTILLKPVSPGI